LRAQPQRPGELTELIDISVEAEVLARLERESPVALPRELGIYIAAEAERSLQEAARLFAVEAGDLAADLDEATSALPARGARHLLVRPLEAYAAALEHGLERLDESGAAVRARVPHQVAARWAQSAAAGGVPFERWLGQILERASGARVSWEAAAARSARGLAEWVLVQAARSTRSRNTPPQTTASG
jgi:hypothetical protein